MTDFSEISQKSDQTYTSCYCEENIWHLCDKIKKTNRLTENQKAFVIFISNKNKTVPLWNQSSSQDQEGLVIWDYHVILIIRNDDGSTVFDLDTNLPYPCEFNCYTSGTFKSDENILPDNYKFLHRLSCPLRHPGLCMERDSEIYDKAFKAWA